VDVIAPQVMRYLEQLVPPRDPEMQAMEAHATATDFPIIGPAAGYFCYLMARLTQARRIFELGSGFGYSTAWFARAVRDNGGGVVHHVVWDQQLSDQAKQHLAAMQLSSLVEFHVGEAVAELSRSDEQFDLIFNDIDKQGYPASLPVIEKKLRAGGLLITDNALWSGRIFDESDQKEATAGVREFTRMITSSDKWIASIVPIRDGMFVARRGRFLMS
jgi:caffeoyl-CoA O-methyltransferase